MSKYFNSGEEYTLADFFSNNNKIIIPDLQRDYCWGVIQGNKELLATEFMSSLIELFNENPSEEFTLGLIYGYELENSGLSGHTHLCDGQQRITTLFLLLGMLNRKTDGKFKQYLISDFELNKDGREPYLQYAIRESTLYFLSDLVCEFFLKDDIKAIDDVKKQDWYFDDYNLDSSIVSMLEALKLIEKKLGEVDNLAAFGDFVVSKLQMLYYDMGTRIQGEETFVVINSTGEPLTPTENLKPRYISQLTDGQEQASELWEEWENFFWLNRAGGGKMKNDTADKGFLEFLRWVMLLNSNKDVFEEVRKGENFNIDKLDAETIQEYFEAVKFAFIDGNIFPNNKDWLAPSKDMNNQIEWFRILPVIEYIKRFGKEDDRNVLRVKRFFKNMAGNSKVSGAIAQMLPQAIKIIKELPSADIADMLRMEGISETLLTAEERLKFTIYKNTTNRNDVEDALWQEEEHKVWNGEIIPILEWSGGVDLDFVLYKKYSTLFSTLFYGEMDQPELDVVRRALLTRELGEYPKRISSNINYTFCWHYSEWKTLIYENSDKFKSFFDELLDKEDIYQILNEMIENNPEGKDYDEFVKIPKLLKYCGQKNIQWIDGKGWILINKERRSGAHANLKSYHLYLDLLKDTSLDANGWQVWFYQLEGSCVVIENKSKDIAIDLFLEEDLQTEDLFKLQFFKRDKPAETQTELADVAKKWQLEWSNSRRYESQASNRASIVQMLYSIVRGVDNMNK